MNFVTLLTKHKKVISDKPKKQEEYKFQFHFHLIQATLIESISLKFIKINNNINLYEIIYFIPHSFLFEIIFDFFHYITHRLLHTNKKLFFIHKLHHKYVNPEIINTFSHSPLDLIITNSIPSIITFKIIPEVSIVTFHMTLVAKTYTELCGHIGRYSFPTTSFFQFIWLVKLLYKLI